MLYTVYTIDACVDLWSALEVLEEEGCSMFVPEELLVKVEVSCSHYLVESKIAWHCTHVLSSTSTPMPVIILFYINKAIV
jgi:hypothetical protein